MIKITPCIRFLLLGLFFFCTTTVLYAYADRGAELYKQNLRTACGFSGNVMAKKHTHHEWNILYETGQLNNELLRLCPHAKPLKEDLLNELYIFLYYYASDSGNKALCY